MFITTWSSKIRFISFHFELFLSHSLIKVTQSLSKKQKRQTEVHGTIPISFLTFQLLKPSLNLTRPTVDRQNSSRKSRIIMKKSTWNEIEKSKQEEEKQTLNNVLHEIQLNPRDWSVERKKSEHQEWNGEKTRKLKVSSGIRKTRLKN